MDYWISLTPAFIGFKTITRVTLFSIDFWLSYFVFFYLEVVVSLFMKTFENKNSLNLK